MGPQISTFYYELIPLTVSVVGTVALQKAQRFEHAPLECVQWNQG